MVVGYEELFCDCMHRSGCMLAMVKMCFSSYYFQVNAAYHFLHFLSVLNFSNINMFQVIAGLIEHRLGEDLMAHYNQPLLANLLSFVSRIINSYWGTQVCHF